MPPPSPPPFCAGFGLLPNYPGYDGAPVRLKPREPVQSAAYANVQGNFTVTFRMRIFINADFSTFPTTARHDFTALVQFQEKQMGSGDPDEHVRRKHNSTEHIRTRPNPGFRFERYVRASAIQPAFESLESEVEAYSQDQLPFEYGDTVLMTLMWARWNRSPQRGREQWDQVERMKGQAEEGCHDD